GPQGLPGEILALAPSAETTRHALAGRGVASPVSPRVVLERALAVGREILGQVHPRLPGEARTYADVLQHAGVVEQPKEERADRALPRLVPSKAGHHAVALALVLDLEHDAAPRLVDAGRRLGHHPIET